ncbi:MAG: AAA family ATPase [Deltaproteobacteria bacterium]|nr:AAA family ATPase [Deltaproteobacteria bacterium]
MLFSRNQELQFLESVAKSRKSEWLFIRGRRRIGKTWLLKKFQSRSVRTRFYIAGSKGARLSVKLKNFAKEWDAFTGKKELSRYNILELSWLMIFRQIHSHVIKHKKSLVIILDEIQWLSNGGDCFSGDLKSIWVEWQQSRLIKVIVCGSSTKFFKEATGGEDKMLRGLQTRPHLWVNPISPREIKQKLLRDWSVAEAAMTYMMAGGVPYYLERLDPAKGFIHAINDAFFTAENHLLDEIDELLNFDFNKTGIKTVKRILATLGQDGCTQANIIAKTGLAQSTVGDLLAKLTAYDIVSLKIPAGGPHRADQIKGVRYYMKDFFLNFYFQILRKAEAQIRQNDHALIFPVEADLSRQGLYMPNFSGKAFELFIRYLFESGEILKTKFARKILLTSPGYEVRDYWDRQQQIDLIVEHQRDRLSRIIECKWQDYRPAWIDETLSKKYPTTNQIRYYVVSPSARTATSDSRVIFLSLNDYYL